MDDAILAIVYKKGSTDLPQNYRPIALLSVIYKLLASVTQARISRKMDRVIDTNPFDFRKGRSTSQPLFILRRTQEVQEEAALENHLLLLDGEKASDKVSQRKMIRAIRRLGVPDKIINMIKAIDVAPNYVIRKRRHDNTQNPENWNQTRMPIVTLLFYHADDRYYARCGILTYRARTRDYQQGPTTQTSKWKTVLRR